MKVFCVYLVLLQPFKLLTQLSFDFFYRNFEISIKNVFVIMWELFIWPQILQYSKSVILTTLSFKKNCVNPETESLKEKKIYNLKKYLKTTI